LVRRAAIERLGLRFDPAFGPTSGEDSDFFARLASSGALLIATDNAIVFEHVPPTRLKVNFMRERFMRGGQGHARITLRGSPGWRRITYYVVSLIKVFVWYFICVALRLFRRDLSFRAWINAWLNIGKLREAIGLPIPRFQ